MESIRCAATQARRLVRGPLSERVSEAQVEASMDFSGQSQENWEKGMDMKRETGPGGPGCGFRTQEQLFSEAIGLGILSCLD